MTTPQPTSTAWLRYTTSDSRCLRTRKTRLDSCPILPDRDRCSNSASGPGASRFPLAQRGHEVYGVDASEAMVEKLRAKAGGEDIPVTIGDFAEVDVEEAFSLVYVVFNTFFALLSQEDQVRCFSNVARRLREGGVFVIEAFVPDMTRWDRDQRMEVLHVESDSVVLGASRHDPVEQRISSDHLLVSEGGVKL